MIRLPKPPWWFCCGWWSPWCLIDTIAHEAVRPLEGFVIDPRSPSAELPGPLAWVCDRHDAAIRKTITEENQ